MNALEKWHSLSKADRYLDCIRVGYPNPLLARLPWNELSMSLQDNLIILWQGRIKAQNDTQEHLFNGFY